MAKCPKCGAEVDAGVKFCMECGEAIPQTKECPKCHTQWPLDAKFCQECGFNFNAVSAGGGAAVAPMMGDKNVIAGDVNNSVSMSNSNNTTNNTVNNTTNNTTNNVTNTTHNVSNVTNNSQVTNNSTTNNMFIRQEIKQETELDKEAKRVQIERLRIEKERQEQAVALEKEARRVQVERLRLEKERQEQAIAKQKILDAAALETEKARQAAELEKERMRLKEIQDEANKSPYSKKTFRKLGLWAGFLGFHYAYVKRWPLFGVTIALMAGMALFAKPADPNESKSSGPSQVQSVEKSVSASEGKTDKAPAKSDPVTMALGLALMVLWFGGTFFVTTDAKGRKLM